MRYRKIVIAIDDGHMADKVASEGYELGRQLNAEIALISVVDTAMNLTDGNITPEEFRATLKQDFKNSHKAIIDQKLKDQNVKSFVAEGKPFEAIIETANEWDADAIVLGTHGRTGLSHLILGSVAEKVIRHWPKAAFIIPAKEF